jgi:hypothetical protein
MSEMSKPSPLHRTTKSILTGSPLALMIWLVTMIHDGPLLSLAHGLSGSGFSM